MRNRKKKNNIEVKLKMKMLENSAALNSTGLVNRINVTNSSAPILMMLLTSCLQSIRYLEEHSIKPLADHGSAKPAHRNLDHSRAIELVHKVRVLCWVITNPAHHETYAVHVNNTWGKRCNKLLFVSTEEDSDFPTIKLPVTNGWKYFWGKTKHALKYIYEHHREDADWFFKADDDTYVVIENLRYLLSAYTTKDPLYLQGHKRGGPGYVLSRKALDLFVNKGLQSPSFCKPSDDGPEDILLGICLDGIGVKSMSMDSKDSFFPSYPRTLFHNNDFWQKDKYLSSKECSDTLDGCADYAISFHHVQSIDLYVYDYLIYRMRPYGVRYDDHGSDSRLPRD